MGWVGLDRKDKIDDAVRKSCPACCTHLDKVLKQAGAQLLAHILYGSRWVGVWAGKWVNRRKKMETSFPLPHPNPPTYLDLPIQRINPPRVLIPERNVVNGVGHVEKRGFRRNELMDVATVLFSLSGWVV